MFAREENATSLPLLREMLTVLLPKRDKAERIAIDAYKAIEQCETALEIKGAGEYAMATTTQYKQLFFAVESVEDKIAALVKTLDAPSDAPSELNEKEEETWLNFYQKLLPDSKSFRFRPPENANGRI